MLEPFKDVMATAPKEAVFRCNIDLGQPTAKVRCFRDGREIADSSKYSIVVRGDEIRLVVRDTELADEAKYRCEASNKIGSVDTEAKLTMKSTHDDEFYPPVIRLIAVFAQSRCKLPPNTPTGGARG